MLPIQELRCKISSVPTLPESFLVQCCNACCHQPYLAPRCVSGPCAMLEPLRLLSLLQNDQPVFDSCTHVDTLLVKIKDKTAMRAGPNFQAKGAAPDTCGF
jgi:hypothetical protein